MLPFPLQSKFLINSKQAVRLINICFIFYVTYPQRWRRPMYFRASPSYKPQQFSYNKLWSNLLNLQRGWMETDGEEGRKRETERANWNMYPTFFVTLIATLDPAIVLLLSYNVIEPSVIIFISHGDEITFCSINTQFT